MTTTGVNTCNQIGKEKIFNFQAGNFDLILVSWIHPQPSRMYDSAKVHRQGFVTRINLWCKITRHNTWVPAMGDVECSFAMRLGVVLSND